MLLAHAPRWSTGPGLSIVIRTSSQRWGICTHQQITVVLTVTGSHTPTHTHTQTHTSEIPKLYYNTVYISRTNCLRCFGYGPGDASASQNPYIFFAALKSRMVCSSGTSLASLFKKSVGPVKIKGRGVGVVVCLERGADYLPSQPQLENANCMNFKIL